MFGSAARRKKNKQIIRLNETNKIGRKLITFERKKVKSILWYMIKKTGQGNPVDNRPSADCFYQFIK